MDPLSPLTEETSDSDNEFFPSTETDIGTPGPLQEPTQEHGSRFHGKSSLLAFTNRAFNEKSEASSTSRARTYREEFWITPDVILSIWFPRVAHLYSSG
jgi:hypothetical protein